MRGPHVPEARPVVLPQHPAGFGVERIDVDPFSRPHAGCQVNRPVHRGEHPGTQRPARNHAAVTEKQVIARCALEPPLERPADCLQAVQIPVVRRDVDITITICRSEPNGAADCVAPPQRSCPRIKRPYRVVCRRTEVQNAVSHDGLESVIEVHPVKFFTRFRPRRSRRLQRHVSPPPGERIREPLTHGAGPRRVSLVRGPVSATDA